MAERLMTDRVVAEHRLSQISTASSTNSKRAKAHIGPWQLGRTLGRGSSGRVRLAKHMESGKLAAVKIVPKAQIMDQATASLSKTSESYGIEREVIIMKLIEHPNIMALYDVWENKGELYLVLEYIEGGELFDYLISRGRLSEREAIHYFRQICYGVDYCHRFNICHRDLKPENLLLDKHRNIKIADFGMAALESNGRLLETSCGSPHYASPEIVTGKTYHGAPSDIWSCGIILFALLSGHLPFDDDNIRQLLLKVQAGKFDMPSSLSPEARDLISKMLIVNPKKRITMRDILRHPLLRKYPSRRIPTENTERAIPKVDVLQPIERIDREILRNLQTLWHHDTKDELISRLRATGPNAEKTFYSLLLRFRQRHGLISREPIPNNKSVASFRSIRSSKSVRSVASLNSKSGSMKSLKSVRSNRSGRSLLSARRSRRSPVKSHIHGNRAHTGASNHHATRNTNENTSDAKIATKNEGANVFAQLLDEAFNRQSSDSSHSTAMNRQRSSSKSLGARESHLNTGSDVNTSGTSTTDAAAGSEPLFRSDHISEPEQTPMQAPGTSQDATVVNNISSQSSSVNADNRRIITDPTPSYNLDFDFSGHEYGATPQTAHNYLLPMIFEEDRFADAIEEEVELKFHRKAGRQIRQQDFTGGFASHASTSDARSGSLAGDQLGDHSQLRIANLVSGESFLSYQPSPAAAAIAAPVRPAPRAPSGPREMPDRKPVPIYVEPSKPNSTEKPVIERRPLATLTADDLRRPRTATSTSGSGNNKQATAPSSNENLGSKPNDLEPLRVTKRGNGQTSLQTDGEKDASQLTDKPKKSWIRRLTPRIVSRKSSKNSPSNVVAADTPKLPFSTDFVDKENVLPQQTNSVRFSKPKNFRKQQERNFAPSEEPRQNWFMKLLTSPTQASSRTLMSTCQPIELRAIILEVVNEWMPHGLALYSDGARGEPIVVAILPNNSLRLKPARIGIDIKPSRASVATAKVVHQKGSQNSFMTFASEMERKLGEINILGVDC